MNFIETGGCGPCPSISRSACSLVRCIWNYQSKFVLAIWITIKKKGYSLKTEIETTYQEKSLIPQVVSLVYAGYFICMCHDCNYDIFVSLTPKNKKALRH